jgi:hypothetical protein
MFYAIFIMPQKGFINYTTDAAAYEEPVCLNPSKTFSLGFFNCAHKH